MTFIQILTSQCWYVNRLQTGQAGLVSKTEKRTCYISMLKDKRLDYKFIYITQVIVNT